jgi:hypothetical protein
MLVSHSTTKITGTLKEAVYYSTMEYMEYNWRAVDVTSKVIILVLLMVANFRVERQGGLMT